MGLANMLEAYFLPLAVACGQRSEDGCGLYPVQADSSCISGVTHIHNVDRQLKKTLIVVGVAENSLDKDVSMGTADGLPQGMVMRPAWMRRTPCWLAVDEMDTGPSAPGWQGLFAEFKEQGFSDFPAVLKKLLEDFDPQRARTLHLARKADVMEKATPSCTDGHDAPKQQSRNMSWRRGDETRGQTQQLSWRKDARNVTSASGSSQSDQQIDRHPDGRPKLKLKPRTRQ